MTYMTLHCAYRTVRRQIMIVLLVVFTFIAAVLIDHVVNRNTIPAVVTYLCGECRARANLS